MADGYSKAHIEKVLWDVHGLYLIDEHRGEYKAYRYRQYHTYQVVNESGTVLARHITLKALADFLKSKDDY